MTPAPPSDILLCEPTSAASSSCTTSKERNRRISQDVLLPAYTNDYRVVSGKCGGLGMVANRPIKKGEMVMTDSLEFLFADVEEGDTIILVGHELASAKSEAPVPERIPVTRDMLTRSHGVPVLAEDPHGESAGIQFYRLEIPWMLINHSCDPNCVDSSHKEPEGELIAARDIAEGEELTYPYNHQFYDGDYSFQCFCGAQNCQKIISGFQALPAEEKDRIWPHVSDYIKARHLNDIGKGPAVRIQIPEFPERTVSPGARRLVVPGPSCAESSISVSRDEKTGEYRLYAAKDFEFGEKVYSFWTFVWPEQGTVPIDMVAASDLLQGDLPEGTTIRVNPLEHGMPDAMGRMRFSGYDMMTVHSCEPNMVYNHKDEDDQDDWRSTFAARPIKKGEMLTIDYNTVWWDRSQVGDGVCHCGAAKCRGTLQGYRHLSKDQQDDLMSLSWLRLNPPYEGESRLVCPGDALSPAIHAALGKDAADVTESTSESVTSSSNNSDGNSSEEE